MRAITAFLFLLIVQAAVPASAQTGANRPPAAAEHFVARAQRIAESLELGVAGQNGVLLSKGQRLKRHDAEVFLPFDVSLQGERTA